MALYALPVLEKTPMAPWVGPGVEVCASCEADGGVLYAVGGDGVVEVVCIGDFGYVWCLVICQ